MKPWHYPLLLALAMSLCACGVKRNLKLPEPEKPAVEQSEETQP